MKRIIYLLLICVATCGTSCARDHRGEPCNPYYPGDTYRPGNGNGETEGENPSTNNSDNQDPRVCEDYYNRYLLADGVNIFLSEHGTLYWCYWVDQEPVCPKICWADLSLRRDGNFIRVYRLINGEMRQVECLECGKFVARKYRVLFCPLEYPDYLLSRTITIVNPSGTSVVVEVTSPTDEYKVDEYLHM